MKVSICLTVKNEEKSIARLLDSLLAQTKKPDEIVIVDGGSSDETTTLIRHFQKKDKRIRLLVEKCSRAKGRNLSVELSRNDIVAITDADCVADKNWLKRLIQPLEQSQVDISAGFYNMKASNAQERAMSVFLGVTLDNFDVNFLPSTRSIAFRKQIWEKIGGFPERDDNSAEDTDFNYKAVKIGANFARVKNARVEWSIPKTYKEFAKKIYNYARWDASFGNYWHPLKKLTSHNIKSLYKIFRYLVGLIFVIYAFRYSLLWPLIFLSLLVYSFWAFRKVYKEFQDWRTGFWGIIIQYTSDFVVMTGFLVGITQKIFPKKGYKLSSSVLI